MDEIADRFANERTGAARVARRGLRARRYAFHPDEVAEAEAQGLPYVLVPRVLSKQEWLERYATPGAEAEFYARLRYGEQPAGADSGVKTIQEPAATALLPNCP